MKVKALGAASTALIVSFILAATANPAAAAIDAESISAFASKAIQHMAKAREALRVQSPANARAQLLQATKLFERLRAALPMTPVKSRIWATALRLRYEADRNLVPELTSIRGDIEAIASVIPVSVSKRYLDAAKVRLDKDDNVGAASDLRRAEDALVYTELELPLDAAQRQLQRAMTSLSQEKKAISITRTLDKADYLLLSLVAIVRSPLHQARGALLLARNSYASGRPVEAREALQSAVVQLEAAVSSADTTSRIEAAKLAREAKRLSERWSDAAFGQATDMAGVSLNGIAAKTVALSERAAEEATFEWQTLELGSNVRAYLLEAKLHLAYARVSHIALTDEVAATTELQRAIALLNKAMEQAGAAEGRIKGLRASLDRLVHDLTAPGDKNPQPPRERYDVCLEEMRDLVHDDALL